MKCHAMKIIYAVITSDVRALPGMVLMQRCWTPLSSLNHLLPTSGHALLAWSLRQYPNLPDFLHRAV